MTSQPSDTATVFDLALAQLALGDYAPIRYVYTATISGLINDYLYSDNVKVTTYQNAFKRAIQEAFYPAFEQGLEDGGGEVPAQGDDLAWVNAKAEAERGFSDMLWQQLKELKAEQRAEDEAAKKENRQAENLFAGVGDARAAGYARTLDAVYSEGKIRGAKNQMLTFGGSDGEESCDTCQKLKGARHRASWWKNHGLIPGQPGNSQYECGGFRCQHVLFSDKGEIFTV